jgi:hypothetical protein
VRIEARPIVRFVVGFCLAAAALTPIVPAGAEDTDDSLRAYAVDILQPPSQSRSGNGIYLGKGLVITAAHVVGQSPKIRIGGLDLPASIVKRSAYEQEDLTLLSVDEHKPPSRWSRAR